MGLPAAGSHGQRPCLPLRGRALANGDSRRVGPTTFDLATPPHTPRARPGEAPHTVPLAWPLPPPRHEEGSRLFEALTRDEDGCSVTGALRFLANLETLVDRYGTDHPAIQRLTWSPV